MSTPTWDEYLIIAPNVFALNQNNEKWIVTKNGAQVFTDASEDACSEYVDKTASNIDGVDLITS